jgi:hypothetical protein
MSDEVRPAKSPDVSKVLDLYNSQTGAVNTLWNIFIAVNLGIIGFLYKDEAAMGHNPKIKIGFTLGFILYATANRVAIMRSQKILYTISEFLRGVDLDDPKVRPILLAHDAFTPARVGLWHLLFTVLVALVLWSPEIAGLLR